MATSSRTRTIDYPTSDGKPMAETDLHRDLMVDLIATLDARFEHDPDVYVSGDLLLFYEQGNKRRHVAPDVFVVFGVPNRKRDHYLLWDEGRGPDIVVEVTSKSTRREDQGKKRTLYQDVLQVPEYFQFDPTEDYLRPPFQGHRLVRGVYQPIVAVDGRLPSVALGLLLERDGPQLRLVDPVTGRRLPTPREQVAEERAGRAEQRRRAIEAEVGRAEQRRRAIEAEAGRAEQRRRAIEAEAMATAAADRAIEAEVERDRLRRELEALKRRLVEQGE